MQRIKFPLRVAWIVFWLVFMLAADLWHKFSPLDWAFWLAGVGILTLALLQRRRDGPGVDCDERLREINHRAGASAFWAVFGLLIVLGVGNGFGLGLHASIAVALFGGCGFFLASVAWHRSRI